MASVLAVAGYLAMALLHDLTVGLLTPRSEAGTGARARSAGLGQNAQGSQRWTCL